MEAHAQLQTPHQPSVSALSPSSSSSPSCSASVVPLSFSPVWTEPHGDKTEPLQAALNRQYYMAENGGEASTAGSATKTQWLRFVGTMGNGGMEWKGVEERFDRLALTGNGVEPVIKWSDFGLCIGEQA